jgi:hypothetical protein
MTLDGAGTGCIPVERAVSVYVDDPMLLKEAIIEWGRFPK